MNRKKSKPPAQDAQAEAAVKAQQEAERGDTIASLQDMLRRKTREFRQRYPGSVGDLAAAPVSAIGGGGAGTGNRSRVVARTIARTFGFILRGVS